MAKIRLENYIIIYRFFGQVQKTIISGMLNSYTGQIVHKQLLYELIKIKIIFARKLRVKDNTVNRLNIRIGFIVIDR